MFLVLCDDCVCMFACLLTVEADVMVGEDCGTVALSSPPHGDVQHTMGRLHVVLLNKTTNTHHPVSNNNKQTQQPAPAE